MTWRGVRPLRVLLFTAAGIALVIGALAVVRPGVEWIEVVVEEDSVRTNGIEPGPVRWLKGQTHAHTWNSGDSETPTVDVLRWYSEHGFEFVVLTDHNVMTVAASSHGVLAIPGVELTLGPEKCDPPPEPGMYCALHLNALFVDPARKPPRLRMLAETKRLAIYGTEVEAALALGGLPVVNHPNYQYAADADLIAALAQRGAMFVEMANEASDSVNGGDEKHPSVEAMWDSILSRGVRLWGLASDDAHDYYDAEDVAAQGLEPRIGNRGFVMVRARNEPGSIRAAMERGDFYSSTGVILERIAVEEGRYVVEAPGEVTTTFVTDGGTTVLESTGRSASVPLEQVKGTYLRARVTDAEGRRAWTQPIFLKDPSVAAAER